MQSQPFPVPDSSVVSFGILSTGNGTNQGQPVCAQFPAAEVVCSNQHIATLSGDGRVAVARPDEEMSAWWPLEASGDLIAAGAEHIAVLTDQAPITLHVGMVSGSRFQAAVPLPSQCIALAAGGRQTMVLLEGDMLMLYPNVEALIENPSSQNPLVCTKMSLSQYIPMQAVKQLGCGALHFVLLTCSGLVYTWGTSEHGALGHGDDVKKVDSPRLVDGMYNVSRVACGHGHTCALEADAGDLYSWGWNEYGQCGHANHAEKRVEPSVCSPRVVQALCGRSCMQVSCGWAHTAVIVGSSENTEMLCFGYNEFGQLGSIDFRDHLAPQTAHTGLSLVHTVRCGGLLTLAIPAAAMCSLGAPPVASTAPEPSTAPLNVPEPSTVPLKAAAEPYRQLSAPKPRGVASRRSAREKIRAKAPRAQSAPRNSARTKSGAPQSRTGAVPAPRSSSAHRRRPPPNSTSTEFEPAARFTTAKAPASPALIPRLHESPSERKARTRSVDGRKAEAERPSLWAKATDHTGKVPEKRPTSRSLAAAPAKQRDRLGSGRGSFPGKEEQVVKGTTADELVAFLMKRADRHNTNGVLTVNELRTFLPNHEFTSWLTRTRGLMLKYDVDGDGGISSAELYRACEDFLSDHQQGARIGTPPKRSTRTSDQAVGGLPAQIHQLKQQVQSLELENLVEALHRDTQGLHTTEPVDDVDRLSVSQLERTERIQDERLKKKSGATTARTPRTNNSPAANTWASGAQTQRGPRARPSRESTSSRPSHRPSQRGSAARATGETKRAISEPRRRRESEPKRAAVVDQQPHLEQLLKQLEEAKLANTVLQQQLHQAESSQLVLAKEAAADSHMQLQLSQALAAQHEAEQALERERRRNNSLVTMVEAAEAENHELELSERSTKQQLARAERENARLMESQQCSTLLEDELRQFQLREEGYVAKIDLLQQQLLGDPRGERNVASQPDSKLHTGRAASRAGGSRVRFQDL